MDDLLDQFSELGADVESELSADMLEPGDQLAVKQYGGFEKGSSPPPDREDMFEVQTVSGLEQVGYHTEIKFEEGGSISDTALNDDVFKPNESLKESQSQNDKTAFERATEFHEDRSAMEQRVDENRKAPTTNDVDKWMDNPDEWDFPGVDTVD